MLNQDEQNRVIKRKKSFTQEEIAAVLGLDLPEIIQNLGYKIIANNGKNICFENPLRIENTPSFSVYLNGHLWFWKDWGTGESGNVIHFWQKFKNLTFPEAVKDLQGKTSFSFYHPISINAPQAPKITINKVKRLENRALLQYLQERKIPLDLAQLYLQEAYFSLHGKAYFALAFGNDKGGFELRNKFFKGSSTPKGMTTFEANTQQLCIFEGFTDFLAAMAYYKTDKPKYKTIVLNSLSFLTDDLLATFVIFERVNSFLDNDEQGLRNHARIAQAHPHVRHFTAEVMREKKDWAELGE